LILEKITQNGFSVELDGDSFTVAPSDQLTQQQREFLKQNKPQIMQELLLTTVYNLNGVPMQVQAKDAQHKAWLIKVNHNSTTPVNSENWYVTDDD
jgi:carbamoylphosphate synthase large subunit